MYSQVSEWLWASTAVFNSRLFGAQLQAATPFGHRSSAELGQASNRIGLPQDPYPLTGREERLGLAVLGTLLMTRELHDVLVPDHEPRGLLGDPGIDCAMRG
jgi:hypothetical protein